LNQQQNSTAVPWTPLGKLTEPLIAYDQRRFRFFVCAIWIWCLYL